MSGVLCQLPPDLTNRVSEENRFRLNNFLGRKRDRKAGRDTTGAGPIGQGSTVDSIIQASTMGGMEMPGVMGSTFVPPSSPGFDSSSQFRAESSSVPNAPVSPMFPSAWTTETTKQKPPRPPKVSFPDNKFAIPTNGPTVVGLLSDVGSSTMGTVGFSGTFGPNKPPPPPPPPKVLFPDTPAIGPTDFVPGPSRNFPIIDTRPNGGPYQGGLFNGDTLSTRQSGTPTLPVNTPVQPSTLPNTDAANNPNDQLTNQDIRNLAERIKSRGEIFGAPKPAADLPLPTDGVQGLTPKRIPSNKRRRIVSLGGLSTGPDGLPTESLPGTRLGPLEMFRSMMNPIKRLIRALMYRHLLLCSQRPDCRILAVRRSRNRPSRVFSFNSLEDIQKGESGMRARRMNSPVYRSPRGFYE